MFAKMLGIWAHTVHFEHGGLKSKSKRDFFGSGEEMTILLEAGTIGKGAGAHGTGAMGKGAGKHGTGAGGGGAGKHGGGGGGCGTHGATGRGAGRGAGLHNTCGAGTTAVGIHEHGLLNKGSVALHPHGTQNACVEEKKIKNRIRLS